MRLTCTVGQSQAGAHVKTPACGQPAVMVLLAEQEVWHAGDVVEDILTAYPRCPDHSGDHWQVEQDVIAALPLNQCTDAGHDSDCEGCP